MTGPKTLSWTTARRLWGNLFPAGVSLLAGAIAWPLTGRPPLEANPDILLQWAILSAWVVVAGWLALVVHPLFLNRTMRSELEQRAAHPRHAHFVGFASPGYRGLLDPHEDVGFLWFDAEGVRFSGEARSLELPRGSIQRVRFRPSVHTWVGLGGWMSVEGVLDGTPVRLLAESRNARTMVGCLLATRKLVREGRGWLAAQK